jgi:hypothetical protein
MHRQFVDSLGYAWQVWEIDTSWAADHVVLQPRAQGWLYFLSRGTTRRIDSYPGDWASGSWVDLEDLCLRAEELGAERVTGLVRSSERPPVAIA